MEKVQAVIFDVYHTLLAVREGPGPAEAAGRWGELWRDFFGGPPEVGLGDFDEACRALVAGDHAAMRAERPGQPEVDWRSVACRAVPALAELRLPVLDDFLYQQARLQRTTSAMPGAAGFLAALRGRGMLTGIASNAQLYTLPEMAAAGLPVEGFARDLCFFSFEHGFAKPDAAVFAWLSARLAARGIAPEETLMIGDRLDNDMAPAQAAGWRTWHFQGIWPEV